MKAGNGVETDNVLVISWVHGPGTKVLQIDCRTVVVRRLDCKQTFNAAAPVEVYVAVVHQVNRFQRSETSQKTWIIVKQDGDDVSTALCECMAG